MLIGSQAPEDPGEKPKIQVKCFQVRRVQPNTLGGSWGKILVN